MIDIHRLKGRCRHYAWGGQQYINELLSRPSSGEPVAEYWLGTHPTAPSTIEIDGQSIELRDLLNNQFVSDPSASLENLSDLPYLFKVLDVAQPLSIQVHPDSQQALDGFRRESEAGIPLDDATRNYVDTNAKPELAVALSDFFLLYGFRSLESIRDALARHESLKSLSELVRESNVETLFRTLMASTEQQRADWIMPVYQSCVDVQDRTDYRYWIDQWRRMSNTDAQLVDRGVLCMLLMNIVHLQPGQAIFQGSNVPHAYLSGQCIEAMANSDNVLRCGLTPKHVDIEELLNLIHFESADAQKLTPSPYVESQGTETNTQTRFRYQVPVDEFVVERLQLRQSETVTLQTGSVLLLMQGSMQCQGHSQSSISVNRGDALYVSQTGECRMEVNQAVDLFLCRPGNLD